MTIHAVRLGGSRTLAPVLFALALLGAPFLAPSVQAQGKDGEIWVGLYQPDPSFMDDDISFGLRSLFHAPDGLGFGVELGYVAASGEATSGAQTGSVDWDALWIEGIFDLPLGHSKKAVPSFFFGAGFAFESADSEVEGPIGSIEVDDLDGTSFTAQAGFGVKFVLGDHFYLRPAARLHWFEARGSDDLDTEYILGFGRTF
jgi:hypothetical protein